MSAMQRRKGKTVELEIVNRHKDIGIHAERVPLSGAAHYKSAAHDIDIYLGGRDGPPQCCEVKARKNGSGFVQLERWVGDNDMLFLRRNNADPFVVLPWRTYAALLAVAKLRSPA